VVDLNGKAMAWEAAILLPFVDEEIFLQNEK
jgi:5'-3' exonuclease